jgi:hypothetical protein
VFLLTLLNFDLGGRLSHPEKAASAMRLHGSAVLSSARRAGLTVWERQNSESGSGGAGFPYSAEVEI